MPTLTTAKPKLRLRAPLIYYLSLGYFPVYVLIGLSLWLSVVRRLPYVIVQPPFDTRFWGVVFITLGVLTGISLLSNHWKFIRWVLIVGLFIKALWFYALLLQIGNGGLGIIAIWSFLAYAQLLTVIYFPEG